MIKTEPLRKAISLTLASSYILNEKSVSLLVIAKPESGKTNSLIEFSGNDSIYYASDMTYTGLVGLLSRFKEKQLRTLLIPDLLKIFGRKSDTSKNFITLLNEFIEEGIMNIDTYAEKVSYDNPVRGNMISAITSTDFYHSVGYWGSIGFISRVIPFSYSYSIHDVEKILMEVMKGSNTLDMQKFKKMKDKKVDMSVSLSQKLRGVTENLRQKFIKKTKIEIYGFRFQRQLQVMAKASALLNKRTKVTVKDINLLLELSNWFNYDFNPL